MVEKAGGEGGAGTLVPSLEVGEKARPALRESPFSCFPTPSSAACTQTPPVLMAANIMELFPGALAMHDLL